MSDGPHKSLPMPPAWKRVAERADNAAFESDEIRKALIPALEHDCRTEMSPALLDDVRSLIEGQDASLFKSDVRPQLEALRTMLLRGARVPDRRQEVAWSRGVPDR